MKITKTYAIAIQYKGATKYVRSTDGRRTVPLSWPTRRAAEKFAKDAGLVQYTIVESK